MKRCPDCHAKLKGWEVFCPKCSSDLLKAARIQSYKARKWRWY